MRSEEEIKNALAIIAMLCAAFDEGDGKNATSDQENMALGFYHALSWVTGENNGICSLLSDLESVIETHLTSMRRHTENLAKNGYVPTPISDSPYCNFAIAIVCNLTYNRSCRAIRT